MNKYIDHLTLEEYELLKEQLKIRLDEVQIEMQETGYTKDYVKIRFLLLKIDSIIKKYKKV